MIELERTAAFMATHARLVDRRRFELLFRDGDAEGALTALAAYANADGGFGWALEPDLRSPASQPVAALHALEVLREAAPPVSPLAGRLLDWLEAVSLEGGALPFALAGAGGPGTSQWWASADPSRPSLHITSALCEAAIRLGAHDAGVARHPWLARATSWCMDRIAALCEPGGAIEFRYVLALLDALHDEHPDAPVELERLAAFVPESGSIPVQGGIEGEAMRPLDFAPEPGRPLRALIAADAIEADLDRLAREQRDDGGWDVDWAIASPAAGVEWRGYITVRALSVLRANGRLDP